MFKGHGTVRNQRLCRREADARPHRGSFETYRRTTDSTERARIYREIDSVSYEASKIAIPNEYDKLMSAIGANGTNAYTSLRCDLLCGGYSFQPD